MSLRLETIPLPHLHTSVIAFALRAGPRYEGDDQRGLSHFLEHMIFRGAGDLPALRDVMLASERLGGEPEAFTSEDSLVIQLGVDPEGLEPALELLAKVLLQPRFEGLEHERELILEERLERTDEDGNPDDIDDVARTLTFEGHRLGRSILGRKRDILACTGESLEAWRQRIVTVENAALVVAGPVTPERVARAAAALQLPSGEALHDAGPLPEPRGPRLKTQRAEGPQTDLRLTFVGPGELDPAFAALSVLADVLDGGPTGRLPERLVDTGLAYTSRVALFGLPDVSLLELDVTCAHSKLSKAVDAVRSLIAGLHEGVSEAELERGRLRRRHSLRALKDDARAQAEDAARCLLFDQPSEVQRIAREDAVTADAARAAAQAFLVPKGLSAVALGAPGKSRLKALRAAIAGW